MQRARAHRGCAFGDLDDDGRVDVVVSVIGEPAEILYNVTAEAGRWLELQLEGTRSNRDGIGASVKLTASPGGSSTTTPRPPWATPARPTSGCTSAWARDRTAREIEIRWPSGTRQILRTLRQEQVLKVKEP